MTDYGKGAVLGAATSLPMTSGIALSVSTTTDPMIVMGLLVISSISLIVLIGSISRYMINNSRNR